MANKHKSYQRFVAAAVSTAVVASAVVPVAAATSITDVKANSFGEKEITYLTSKDIIQGYKDNTFRPAEKLNRGQAARLFARALNLKPQANNKHGFKDIPKSGELAAAVSAVAAAGIFKGTNGEFDANRPLSRQEMASVLVRAFNLKANTTSVKLKDLKTISPAHLNDVKVLYQNKITVGFKDQTFRGEGTISRAEFAVFLYRALDPAPTTIQTVEAVSDSSVKIGGKSYTVAANLKGLLNASNAAILKNAKIKIEATNKQISKVTYLEIVESGKASATEFAGNLVLDGGNSIVAGDVKVSANYITIKNLTVNGNFEITSKLENDFYSTNLVVKGKTIVNGGDSNTVVFNNANLQGVDVNKQGVRVESKGTTTVGEITVTNDATITADDTVTIPKVTVSSGVKSVELNAKVTTLTLKSTNDLKVTGTGSIENVKVESTKAVTLETKGTIKNLDVPAGSKITLSKDTKIENLTVPAGTNPQDVISNYEEIKGNIEKVTNPGGGNPGGGNPGGGNPGGGNPGGGTPNPVDTIDEHVARYISFYGTLTGDEKAALTNAKAVVNGLTAEEWSTILGPVETNMNAKLDAAGKTATAKEIIEGIIALPFSADANTIKAYIDTYRTNYADEFDAVFGADVTVEKLLKYSALYEAKLKETNNLLTLTNILMTDSPNTQDQLKAFLRDIRNQVEVADPTFADFDAKLISGMGVGLDGLFLMGHSAVTVISPKLSATDKEQLKTAIMKLFVKISTVSLGTTAQPVTNSGMVFTTSDKETIEAVSTLTLA
jgi:hypothetical protein